jgi:magnesium transporter
MIRTLYRHRSGSTIIDLPRDQIVGAVRDAQARLWVDLVDPTDEESYWILRELYQFHLLAVKDAVQDVHVPKIDDYGGYLYLVFHTIGLGDERMDIHTYEMDVFLGANYLITMHHDQREVLEKLWNQEYHQQGGLARGPAYLLYELLDRQLDSYIPILDRFEEQLEDLGDALFRRPRISDDAMLNDILTAKSSALRLHRILLPQRELLHRLSRNDYAVIPADARAYFHDLYDHLVRLNDLADSMRDLASSTIETHLALVNNRMNEVMKVLTMISTIFIPLSFVAGIYGMNFQFMPELQMRWGYPLVWLIFIGIGAAMFLFFRRRGWL